MPPVLAAEGFLCAGFRTPGHAPLPEGIAAKPALSGTVGTRSTLVLFAKFRGEQPGQTPSPAWAEGIFDPARPGSFSHFYDTMSFGQLQVRGEVAPRRYESEQEAAGYLSSDPTEPGNFGQFNLEILKQADEDIDFSRFDNDGPDGIPNSGDDDGLVDAVFIVTASAPSNFLLGPATGAGLLGFEDHFATNDLGADGQPMRISPSLGAIQQGRTFAEAVGTMCHEYGHVLGLPDLFDVEFLQKKDAGPEEDSAGIGAWGLMGWGALGWNGDDGPNSFCAWSRLQLGWSAVVEVEQELQELRLEQVGGGGALFRTPLRGQLEYFLLEYRRRTGTYYDRHLPEEGVLIWHVERRQEGTTAVDLECADGNWLDAGYPQGRPSGNREGGDNLDFWAHDPGYRVEHNGNLGDGTDPFDGVRFSAFTPETNPASYSYDHRLKVWIDNIRFEGEEAVAEVRSQPSRMEIKALSLADADGDRVVVLGEEVQLALELEHEGSFAARDVQLQLRTTDPLVEIVQPQLSLGDVAVGELKIFRELRRKALEFRFARAFVGVHTATLFLDTFIDGQQTGQHEFAVSGVSPQQVLGQVRILDHLGNGDGQAQTGEFIRLELTLEVGDVEALRPFKFSLRPLRNDVIRVGGSRVSFALQGAQVRSQQSPEFLLPSLAPGTQLDFEFEIFSTYGNWQDTLSIKLEAGADQTPPRVGALQSETVGQGLRFVLPALQILEGSGVRAVRVVVYNLEDTSRVTTIPLIRQEEGFTGLWTGAASGAYLVEGMVEDSMGNQGRSALQLASMFLPPEIQEVDTGAWEALMPPSQGEVPLASRLFFTPQHPNVLYAATAEGVWRSIDGGATWMRIGLMEQVDTILIDAADPFTIYVNELKSRNGGMTWKTLDAVGQEIRLVAVDPVQPGRLYGSRQNAMMIGSTWFRENNLMISEDGGFSWRETEAESNAPVQVYLADPRIIYVGGVQRSDSGESVPGVLYHSTDGGTTWTSQKQERLFERIVVDPHAPDDLYATGRDSIWHTADRGSTWALFQVLKKPTWASLDLAIHPRQPGLFFAWSTGGQLLWKSVDGGIIWETVPLPAGVGSIENIVLHLWNPRLIFLQQSRFAASNGILSTEDDGKNWEGVRLPETTPPAGTLFFEKGQFYVGSRHTGQDGRSEPGVATSTDSGLNWTWLVPDEGQFFGLSPSDIMNVLVVDPTDPQRMIAHVGSWRFLRTADGGRTWNRTGSDNGFPGSYPVILADPQEEAVYYIAQPGTGILRSENAGLFWRERHEGLPDDSFQPPRVGGFALDPQSPATLYAAIQDSIWRSGDAGLTWEHIGDLESEQDIVVLAFHPLERQKLYAVTHEGFFVSGDRGKFWELLARLDSKDSDQMRLRFSPHDPARMYLVAGSHLLESPDGGRSWASIGDDLVSVPRFNDVAVDPADSSLIYAATPWGVYRLDQDRITVVEEHNAVPELFSLQQNYPNPFNPSTTISYQLSQTVPVQLTVYNIAGQPVRRLVNEVQLAGVYQVTWDGRDDRDRELASGVYLYRLQAGEQVETRKLVLLR